MSNKFHKLLINFHDTYVTVDFVMNVTTVKHAYGTNFETPALLRDLDLSYWEAMFPWDSIQDTWIMVK